MEAHTDIYISFSQDNLLILNICLGFIMFGVALGIQPQDFKALATHPKGVFAGVFSQFILLPLLTVLLIILLKPAPGIALGMILVAACPGGNISNYISSISGANAALSVGLTAFATVLCPIFTPLNFELWGHALSETNAYMRSFAIGFGDMLKTVLLLLVIPLLAGLWFSKALPIVASRVRKPVNIASFLILVGFIAIAILNNFDAFKNHLGLVFLIVALHNAVAFAGGYSVARLARLSQPDRRSVTIETGIQNSGLGLVLIFTFFNGNGQMAIVAAWWGVWHIIAGLVLAWVFRVMDRRVT